MKEQTETADCFVRPPANITENGAGYVAEVELPGVSKDNLEITFEHGELTIVGRRAKSDLPETAKWLHRESRGADFKRSFELGSTIDASAITASFDSGLLVLQLPKLQAAASRKIEINGLN